MCRSRVVTVQKDSPTRSAPYGQTLLFRRRQFTIELRDSCDVSPVSMEEDQFRLTFDVTDADVSHPSATDSRTVSGGALRAL